MPNHSHTTARQRRFASIGLWALVVLSLTVSSPLHAWGKSRLEWEASYRPQYESNIFHTAADSSITGAVVNNLAASVGWRARTSLHLHHRVLLSGDYDQYVNHASRDQGTIELSYQPRVRYTRHGRIYGEATVARRSKDLIDDAGQSLTRTLTRWEMDLKVSNRLTLQRLHLEQSVRYNDLNYDERDTLAIYPNDTVLVHLLSYDYHAAILSLDASYDILANLEARFNFDWESRDYRERRTYTVRYGATIGRPFAIRSLHESTYGTELRYQFYRENEIRIAVDYVNRTDNFEDFYGYVHRQYKATLIVVPLPAHETTISFRFKNKDYPNYYTRAIGRSHRVFVDYADLQIEHAYRLSPAITIEAYLRNYNKTSNDLSFAYHDFSTGAGVTFNY